MSREVTLQDIKNYQAAYHAVPGGAVVKRTVMNNGINAASEDTAVKAKLNRAFSLELDTGAVSNQKKSGRCWLFSTLNTIRHDVAKQINLKDFEFSENYLSFWDRFEKANAFYEHILATANEPADSRIVTWLLEMPDDDGGQWDNAAALIKKYGAVPQSVMPETFNSENTAEFSQVLGLKLRHDAVNLRKLVQNEAAASKITETKQKMLGEVYRMCTYTFGEVPSTFTFTYRDDNKKYHRETNLTPQLFAQKYISRDLGDYVVLINSPDKPFNRLYTLPMEDNVIGGQHVTFLNVDLATFKALTIQQLKAGETIWFGNDVLQQMNRQEGLLDSGLYKRAELFGVDLSLSKADRLTYREAVVSHAMTLTGVDLVAD